MRNSHDPCCHLAAVMFVLVAASQAAPAFAASGCPTPQPSFAYIDADNDGCYTAGVDSDSVDADLIQPTFVGPAGAGIVIPSSLVLPDQANPHWSIENDVWVDGRIGGPSELIIEAGGTTYIEGSIRMLARGDGYEGDTTLGCETGCGPVVIRNGAKILANGYLTIYDAAIDDDVRVNTRCAPGGDPSCYAWLDLVRPVSIGHRFQVSSPGGIMMRDGTSPLSIGDDLELRTKSVYADGGTIGFDIELNAPQGLAIGRDASIRAGGSVRLGAAALGLPSGPLSIGAGTIASGTGIGIYLDGTSIDVGTGTRLRAKYEVDSAKVMPIYLRAAGTVDIADGVQISGGLIRLDAGIGTLTLGNDVGIASISREQSIRLLGATVTVGAGSKLAKSTATGGPIHVVAASAVSISSSFLRGAGLDVSVSEPAATITFTTSNATGSADTVAIFRAPNGGLCDLSGSTFAKLDLDVSQCGSVAGP